MYLQILALLLDLRVDGINRLGVMTGGTVVYSCHVVAKEPRYTCVVVSCECCNLTGVMTGGTVVYSCHVVAKCLEYRYLLEEKSLSIKCSLL